MRFILLFLIAIFIPGIVISSTVPTNLNYVLKAPPKIEDDKKLYFYLNDLYTRWNVLQVTTVDPNGSLIGDYGQQIIYYNGASYLSEVETTSPRGITWQVTTAGGGSGNGTVTSGSIFQIPYYPATGNTIAGSTNFYNNNTNVGLGTSVGSEKLDVRGTIKTTGFQLNLNPNASYVLQSNSVGVGTWVPSTTLAVTATASAAGGLNAVQYNSPLGTTAGTETVFSMNGINVGIGTTNGINNLLDVRGNSTFIGNIGIGTSKTTTSALTVMNGNVGIGTWKPSQLLHVGNGTLTPTNSIMAIEANAAGVGDSIWGIGILHLKSINASQGPFEDLWGTASRWAYGLSTSGAMNFRVTTDGSDPILGTTTTSFGTNGGMAIGFGNTNAPPANGLEIAGNVGIGTSTTSGGGLIVMNENVGIGTLLPGTALDIQGASRQTGFNLTGNGVTSGFVLQTNSVGLGTWVAASTLATTGTATPAGNNNSVQYNNSGAFGGSDKFVWNGTNVGIGTSDATGQMLTVGNNRFSVTSLGNVTYNQFLNGTAATNAVIQNTSTASGSQTVIIGSAGDSSNLVLRASANVAQVDTNIKFNVGNSGTEAARFNLSGNLGIASTAPGSVLDVQGTARTTGLQLNLAPLANGNVLVSNSVGVGTWMPPSTLGGIIASVIPGGGLNAVQYQSPLGTTTGDETKLSENGTNVGIGTTNGLNLLDIRGNVGVGTSGTQHAELEITGDGAKEPFRVNDSGPNDSTPVTINKGGNIGVGTANASSYQITVIGTPGIGAQTFTTLAPDGFLTNGQWTQIGSTTHNVGTPLQIGLAADSPNTNVLGSNLGSFGRTSTLSSGTYTDFHNNYFGTHTLNTAGATINKASTVYINSAPSGTATMQSKAALWVNNGDTLLVGGNLGVGTFYAPGAKLIVKGNVGINTVSADNGSLLIATGNVGIGTVIPGTLLDVNGTIRQVGFNLNLAPLTNGNVLVSNNLGQGTWMPASTLAVVNPAGGLNAVQYNSPLGTLSGTENVFSFNGTNVGIGTTNGTVLLDIANGNVGIGSTNTVKHALLEVTNFNPNNANAYELFRAQGGAGDTTPFVIGRTANVGVGTTNTGFFQLEVVGDANFTNSINVQDIAHTTSRLLVNGDTSNLAIAKIGDDAHHYNAVLELDDGDVISSAGIVPMFTSSARTHTLTSGVTNYFTNYFEGNNVNGNSVATGATVWIHDKMTGTTNYGSNSALYLENGNEVLANGNLGIGTHTPLNSLIVATGNVGIGTLRPGTALDVQGDIRGSTVSGQTDGTILCIKNGRIGYCSGVVAGVLCTCN